MSGNQLQFSNLSYKTTEQTLLTYFANYGSIEKFILYKDDQDQSLRKGYFIYSSSASIDEVMSKRPHVIDHRQVFLHRTMPTDYSNNSHYLSESLGIQLIVKEIFISRLCSGETREMLMNYFQQFGTILHCRVFNSASQNPRQLGYAFLRFEDYDSVDQIILSRPHIIHSKFYHVRKSIPREYNYITSSIKPISITKPIWRHYAFGLINMQTQAIIYPTKNQYENQEPLSRRKSSISEFELITLNSLSSSISLVDDLTPLPSPLYSTAIAYSPTTDII